MEVKTLTNTYFGMPEIAVTKQKAKNIGNGALNYIYTTDWKKEIRFDIISVVLHKNHHELEHFIDAFH